MNILSIEELQSKTKEELITLVQEHQNAALEEEKYRTEIEDEIEALMSQSRGMQILIEEERNQKEKAKQEIEKYKKQYEQQKQKLIEADRKMSESVAIRQLEDRVEELETQLQKQKDHNEELQQDREHLYLALYFILRTEIQRIGRSVKELV